MFIADTQRDSLIHVSKTREASKPRSSLHDAIAEELLDQLRAGCVYRASLLHAPLPVVDEELSRVGRKMIQDRAAITRRRERAWVATSR